MLINRFFLTASLLLATSYTMSDAQAEEAYEDALLGDWGGARSKLSEHGVDAEISYTGDLIANVSGGKKEGVRALDSLDINFLFDGEKLMGWKGGTASLYFLNNNGGRPDADLVGSWQGFDNIEVPKSSARLLEAWVQQNLFDDVVSVRAGLYDINSEFYVTDPAALFVHSTYGLGTELTVSGLNGASTYPFTALGVRLKIQPNETIYIQSAVLDGVPGDPNNPKGTHIQFNDGDGAFIIAEAGYTPEHSKLALGAWYYTNAFDNFTGTGQTHSKGGYIIGDHRFYCEDDACEQGLSAFARFGFTDDDVNQFDYSWATGLVYTGLFEGRDDGQLGFGIEGVHNGDPFRSVAAPIDASETSFELTYSDQITPWLSIQPDIQYIMNPGTDPALDDALAVGIRTCFNF